MVIDDVPREPNLAEILSARALRTPMDRLRIDIVGGALIAATAIWARPAGWVVLLAAALCFVSYGAWAVAERRLQPVPWPDVIAHEGAWRALHRVAGMIGLASFVLLMLAALGVALGSIIS